MKIKNIEFKNGIFLAPMAGVTDFAFRSIARDFGADLSYTEMVNAKGLVYSHNKDIYKQMLHTEKNEKPCAIQLFGNEVEYFVKAIQLPEVQKFDIIDINMGCPAPKIVKNKEGSFLLNNPELAVEIAKACVNATNKPITIKMRIGYKNGEKQAIDLAKEFEAVGVSAITIHGRTKEQMYSGEIDYETIKKIKQSVSIPVIGNGNIIDEVSYQKMLSTGVDGVMIGRGALGKPWIFNKLLKTNKKINRKFVIKKHFKLLEKIYPEKFIVAHMRKHLLWYVKEEKNASKIRLTLCKIESIKEALENIEKIY